MKSFGRPRGTMVAGELLSSSCATSGGGCYMVVSCSIGALIILEELRHCRRHSIYAVLERSVINQGWAAKSSVESEFSESVSRHSSKSGTAIDPPSGRKQAQHALASGLWSVPCAWSRPVPWRFFSTNWFGSGHFDS